MGQRKEDEQSSFCLTVCWIVANMIIMLAGAGLAVVGTLLLMKDGSKLLSSLYQPDMANLMVDIGGEASNPDAYIVWSEILGFVPIVFVVVGGCLFLCALMGTLSASCPNRYILGFYITIMVIYLIGFITVGVLYFAKQDTFKADLKKEAALLLRKNYQGDRFPKSWDLLINYVQRNFQCCGVADYNDYKIGGITRLNWKNKPTTNQTKGKKFRIEVTAGGSDEKIQLIFPMSCCKQGKYNECVNDYRNGIIKSNNQNKNFNRLTGCWSKVVKATDETMTILMISIGVMILIIGFALTLAFLLFTAVWPAHDDRSSVYRRPSHSSSERPQMVRTPADAIQMESRRSVPDACQSVVNTVGGYHQQQPPAREVAYYVEDPVSRWNAQFGSRFYDQRIFENYQDEGRGYS